MDEAILVLPCAISLSKAGQWNCKNAVAVSYDLSPPAHCCPFVGNGPPELTLTMLKSTFNAVLTSSAVLTTPFGFVFAMSPASVNGFACRSYPYLSSLSCAARPLGSHTTLCSLWSLCSLDSLLRLFVACLPPLRAKKCTSVAFGNRYAPLAARLLQRTRCHGFQQKQTTFRQFRIACPSSIACNRALPLLLFIYIGSGSFGRVFLVRVLSSGAHYALKVMDKAMIRHKHQESHVRDERRILSEMRDCPWVVRLIRTYEDTYNVYLLMEFLPGGELFSVLQRLRYLTVEQAIFYASEILCAIGALHKKGIVYRDLKPENILLDGAGHIKLVDMGFAKRIDDGRAYTTCGTPEYLAPEVIRAMGYTKCVDWWSFGILLYELLVGYSPFGSDQSHLVIYNSILDGKFRFPDHVSHTARNLICGLLNPDPNVRLGSRGPEQIMRHDFFKGVDWPSVQSWMGYYTAEEELAFQYANASPTTCEKSLFPLSPGTIDIVPSLAPISSSPMVFTLTSSNTSVGTNPSTLATSSVASTEASSSDSSSFSIPNFEWTAPYPIVAARHVQTPVAPAWQGPVLMSYRTSLIPRAAVLPPHHAPEAHLLRATHPFCEPRVASAPPTPNSAQNSVPSPSLPTAQRPLSHSPKAPAQCGAWDSRPLSPRPALERAANSFAQNIREEPRLQWGRGASNPDEMDVDTDEAEAAFPNSLVRSGIPAQDTRPLYRAQPPVRKWSNSPRNSQRDIDMLKTQSSARLGPKKSRQSRIPMSSTSSASGPHGSRGVPPLALKSVLEQRKEASLSASSSTGAILSRELKEKVAINVPAETKSSAPTASSSSPRNVCPVATPSSSPRSNGVPHQPSGQSPRNVPIPTQPQQSNAPSVQNNAALPAPLPTYFSLPPALRQTPEPNDENRRWPENPLFPPPATNSPTLLNADFPHALGPEIFRLATQASNPTRTAAPEIDFTGAVALPPCTPSGPRYMMMPLDRLRHQNAQQARPHTPPFVPCTSNDPGGNEMFDVFQEDWKGFFPFHTAQCPPDCTIRHTNLLTVVYGPDGEIIPSTDEEDHAEEQQEDPEE